MSEALRGRPQAWASRPGGWPRPVGVDELQRAIRALDAGEFRRRPSPRTSDTRLVRSSDPGEEWAPLPGELVVPVLGCAGQDGATTLAVAIAGAASVPARVVEYAPAPLSGLAVASDAELGPVGADWQRGRRGNVLLERRIQASSQQFGAPMPVPAGDGPSVTVLDAGVLWPVVHGQGWLARLVGSAPRLVLVSRLSVPGLSRLEASLGVLGEQRVVAAVVGPPRRRWPRSVVCTLGPLARALIGSERLVSVPDNKHLALFGVTSTDLPRPVMAAGRELLTLMEGIA